MIPTAERDVPRMGRFALALLVAAMTEACADPSTPAVEAPSSTPPGPAPAPTPAPAPSPSPVPIAPPVGGCENQSVDARCTFLSLGRVDPQEGFPVRADAPPDSDGTVTFSAEYAIAGGPVSSAAVWVRASPDARATLERFFGEHRDARCAGVILRAPCPPGVHVTVDLPAPPVGTVIRQR